MEKVVVGPGGELMLADISNGFSVIGPGGARYVFITEDEAARLNEIEATKKIKYVLARTEQPRDDGRSS